MQLVTLKWEDGNEERQLSLWDIQEDGSGRLKWQEVEQAFDASRVEIVRGEAASLCGEAPFQGFTEDLYRSGSTISVSVNRKLQGMGPHFALSCIGRSYLC